MLNDLLWKLLGKIGIEKERTYVVSNDQQPSEPLNQPVTEDYKVPEVDGVSDYRAVIPNEAGDIRGDTAQFLMEALDPIQEATNAGRMLRHPMAMTNIPGEQERGVNLGPNRGENPELQNIDAPNPDGTIDRGIARINSATFNGMLVDPYWSRRMAEHGIGNYDDMFDPLKNLFMARLILERSNYDTETQGISENPNYRAWYAAPKDLRMR